MAVIIEVSDKQDYILATYAGEFSVGKAKEAIDRIVQSITEDCLRGVLLDCRQMKGELSVIGRFQTAIHGQKMIGKVSRLALVRPKERAGSDRFIETVAVNRGINLRLFSDINEAVAWLKK